VHTKHPQPRVHEYAMRRIRLARLLGGAFTWGRRPAGRLLHLGFGVKSTNRFGFLGELVLTQERSRIG
jgi:hypothetical protein